jgi:hypothetical protein
MPAEAGCARHHRRFVTNTDDNRGDQFRRSSRPDMGHPTRRQLWVVEDELEDSEAIPATGATAGIPGVWTPDGSTPPADQPSVGGVTASPDTPWTTGQFMACANGDPVTWSGTDWVGGFAP